VETACLPSALINQVKRLAAFQNPEFYKKQAMRLPIALTPRVISCAEDHPQHVGLAVVLMDSRSYFPTLTLSSQLKTNARTETGLTSPFMES
jgi:hypothetical protein